VARMWQGAEARTGLRAPDGPGAGAPRAAVEEALNHEVRPKY
jgi:hypothetical protein